MQANAFAPDPYTSITADDSSNTLAGKLRKGFAQNRNGRPQQSLTTFTQALTKARQKFDLPSEVMALNGLSDSWLLLRQLDKAERSANKSVHISRRLNDPVLLGVALNNLANILTAKSHFPQALQTYQEALLHAQDGGDAYLVVKVLINMMQVHLKRKKTSEINSLVLTAMPLILDLPDSEDKLNDLIGLGYIVQQLNRLNSDNSNARTAQAYKLFSEASNLANELSDLRGKSYALGHLAQLYIEQQRYDEGERLLSQAIFFAEQVDAPEISGQWYWELGKFRLVQGQKGEAITAYERALAAFDSIQNALIHGLRGKSQSFRESTGQVYLEYSALLLDQAESASSEAQRQTVLGKIREVMEGFKAAELKNYFQDYCVTAQQEKNQRLELDNLVKAGSAVLYPVVFPDRTVLLLSLPDGRMKYFKVEVGARELSAAANRLRRHLTPSGNPRRLLKQAGQLYDWLILPVRGELERYGTDTLVVVPDDILRTIPFAALHSGKQYLIEDFALAITPGLRLTTTGNFREPARQRLLLGGVSEGVQGFDELPYVLDEVERIAGIYKGTRLLDNAFEKDTLIQAMESTPYGMISFSTHAVFDADPRKSFLLTYDDKLTLDELERFIRISEFRDQPVELIVLSACDTAIGDERAALGLAGVALKAGARSAMASLWAVNDRSTATLVPAFFQQLKNPAITKAQALQKAQLKLLSDPDSNHPFYWAPFVLIGNWF